ncbi:unnamed protein product [Ectocarpus sp. 13 AM-2016]
MVASQMFLGTAATLIASSTAFVAPVAVRSVATTASSSSLKMSAGSDYVATLPGAPSSDRKIFDPLGLSDAPPPATSRSGERPRSSTGVWPCLRPLVSLS